MTVRWKYEKHGNFSLKSAYRSLEDEPGVIDPLWSKVWKLKVPQRCKTSTWIALHERLLTNVSRWKRRLHNSVKYVICGAEAEDTLHVLRECSETKLLWESIVKQSKLGSFFFSNFRAWIAMNVGDKRGYFEERWCDVFIIICLLLWKRRNEKVFEDRWVSNASLVGKATAIANCMTHAERMLNNTNIPGVPNAVERHEVTMDDRWTLVNADGAFSHFNNKVRC